MTLINHIKLGTRGSPLALKQANMVADALKAAHPDITVDIVPIKSNADWKPEQGEKPLSADQGGKGLFAKEVESAIINGDVDCGVHSLKDIESFMPEELVINHVLPRANPADVFVSKNYGSFDDLPDSGTIGTCSPRRQSLALSKRPDLKIVPFRGNVQTRLDKIMNNQVDGTFLAMAGLERLDIIKDYPDLNFEALDVQHFIPAAAQGIIGIQTLKANTKLHNLLEKIHCQKTLLQAKSERSVLKSMDGSCHSPLAAHTITNSNELTVRSFSGSEDGKKCFYQEKTMACNSIDEAQILGKNTAEDLKKQLPEGFLLS